MSAVFSSYFIPTVEIKLPSVQDRLLLVNIKLRTDFISRYTRTDPN